MQSSIVSEAKAIENELIAHRDISIRIRSSDLIFQRQQRM